MARRQGETSVSDTFTVLECSRDTVYRWIHRRLRGQASPLKEVRRDITGRYWLQQDDIKRLIGEMNAADDATDSY